MKKALLAMVLLAGSALAGPRISIGIGFGAPAPLAMVRPACPGPGYVWLDGYYGRNHVWLPGFWRRPAVVVARIPLPTTDDTMTTGTISGMMTTGTIFAAKQKSYRFLRIPS
jgi:hypothetical protein